MKPAGYSPVYCALYPGLAEIARKHGYALTVHGSMQRDFDVVCIPWTENPSTPEEVVAEICMDYAIKNLEGNPGIKEHGRLVWTLTVSFGECFLDMSFMPIYRNSVKVPTSVKEAELMEKVGFAYLKLHAPELLTDVGRVRTGGFT